jgi:hypothetical protein
MKVYKYFPLNEDKRVSWLMRMIEEQQVWFSLYKNLNDPMEGIYYTFEHSKNKLEEFKAEKQQYLIGCFGLSAKNNNLWRYYADGYKGCCVEFEVSERIENLFKKDIIKYAGWPRFTKALQPSTFELNNIFFRKLNAWRSEKEYRIIVKKNGLDNYVKVGKVTALYLGSAVEDSIVDQFKSRNSSNIFSVYQVYPDTKMEPLKIF